MAPGPRLWGLLAVTAALASAAQGCGGSVADSSWPRSATELEQSLLANRSRSTLVPQFVRCVKVDAPPFVYLCSEQMIAFHYAGDVPLGILGFTARLGTGLSRAPLRCADDVRCWLASACGALPGPGPGPSPPRPASCRHAPRRLPRLRTERPPTPLTAAACVRAWNVHGGFTTAQTTDQPPTSPSAEVVRPVYTTHLAAASLGFISRRVLVRPQSGRCLALFDLGAGNGYLISGGSKWATRFWEWRGTTELSPAPANTRWNACQRADGTLALGHRCPRTRVRGRNIRDELKRKLLAEVNRFGGFPYWLGLAFHGARPSSRMIGKDIAVDYRVTAAGRPLAITIVTRYGLEAIPRLQGVELMRFEASGMKVVVLGDHRPPERLVAEIRRSLRPFQAQHPDAGQSPGDLGGEYTQIDVTASVRTYWVGSTFGGIPGVVVTGAPAGVGLVRYGSSGSPNTFYFASYRPIVRRCPAEFGCVSPPPLPAALRQYGHRVDSFILSDRIVDVLARSDSAVPASGLISKRLIPRGS